MCDLVQNVKYKLVPTEKTQLEIMISASRCQNQFNFFSVRDQFLNHRTIIFQSLKRCTFTVTATKRISDFG